ncbi:hypothetical protein N7492_007861 [Penicillium capsulatum]|uniref:Uncharacterized protein n=1 Tax=Penicillium capsulatum TaxID=69766 RepID=A0A9W9LM31_9EURO|nr:hypothetical protein N7492_007861 [Penicillium capsulatum]
MGQQPSPEVPQSACMGPLGCNPSHQSVSTSVQEDRHPPESNPTGPPRRFAVQLVETSTRSSLTPQPPSNVGRARRRFLPEPVETTKASHPGPDARRFSQPTSTGPRRFKPEVIETDHQLDQGRSELFRSQTYLSASQSAPSTPGCRLGPYRDSFTLPESKFSYASLLRRQEARRHSFRVPELPSIPSNDSEESGESSRSPSRSFSPTNPSTQTTKTPTSGSVSREGHDHELSEYLLSLAARSAQKELKEQALAAFPNEQVYEPVDHFAIDDEERDSEGDSLNYPEKPIVKSRRRSSADLSWELEYMRQHKEEAEQRLRAMATSGNPGMTSIARPSTPKNRFPSPPMLGDDIVVPWSSSPEGTICENSSVNGASRAPPGPGTDAGGLWGATNRPQGARGGAGLWMGTCRKDEDCEQDPQPMSGAMTPMALDEDNESSQAAGSLDLSAISVDEFHDEFVTQIYNYLSLGYPCMARYYDHELSQISGVTVEDLRRDDLNTDAKGHLVTPESDLSVACPRWKALRLYIHEWARHPPTTWEDESHLEAWGMPERRGSWAG